jgi:hypothetical protein
MELIEEEVPDATEDGFQIAIEVQEETKKGA